MRLKFSLALSLVLGRDERWRTTSVQCLMQGVSLGKEHSLLDSLRDYIWLAILAGQHRIGL